VPDRGRCDVSAERVYHNHAQQRCYPAMSRTHQTLQLPVIPLPYRRRAAVLRSNAVNCLAEARRAPSKPHVRPHSPGSQLGLAALVGVAVGMMACMVIFSIVRDEAALSQPPAPIRAPLHP
jgi:hypothetical protein